MKSLLVCLFLTIPCLSSAQCFEDFKKKGDRYNRNEVYEEAITQYLAALLCPSIKQDQRIELIKLIKGALQARVDQLQSALSNVVDNLIQSAEEDILNLHYPAALEKLKDAALLEVDSKKVGVAMMELVYFFNESGQYQRAVRLSDTLSTLLQLKGLTVQRDTMEGIRAYLAKANPERYQQLEARYYPLMIDIPAGTFEMGCNAEIDTDYQGDETPHQVQLSAYRLAKYETTNWQYHLYCLSTGQDSIERTQEGWPLQGHLPVVNVNWYDAVQYSNWVSSQKKLSHAYTINKGKEDENNLSSSDDLKWTVALRGPSRGYRLPTEAEWEYAAQGGVAKKETVYSGSNILKEVGWYGSNSNLRPHPVGALLANGLGLHDMSGNVWEWCWDWYADYEEKALAVNPPGADAGTYRVLRGSSWNDYVDYCRVSNRNGSIPDYRDYSFCFRLAQGAVK